MEFIIKMTPGEMDKAVAKNALQTLIDIAEKKKTETPAQEQVSPAPVVPTAPESAPAAQTVAPAPVVQTETPAQVPQVAEPTTAASVDAAVPTSTVQYSEDDLSRAAVGLIEKDPGKQATLIELIHSFGVQAIPQVPADKRGEFALRLREMGAEI